MQIFQARRGDEKEIYVCRRKSINSLKGFFSREHLKVLLLNAFEEGIVEEIEKGNIFCLMKNKKIIAHLVLYENQIGGIYVNPKFINQGYEQKLLEFGEEVCKKEGFEKVYVYSLDKEGDFYLHNNYSIVGIAYSLPLVKPVKFIYLEKKLI